MRKWIVICTLALSAMVCNMAAPTVTPASDGDTASTLAAAASASAVVVPVTLTPDATTGVIPHEMGGITGKLGYPADSMPAMRVAAFDVVSGEVYFIDTVLGQPTYSLALPVGTYHIVAYSIASETFPAGMAGGYTQAVLCGMAPECANHTLVDVVVSTGASLTDINPLDFYMGEDSTFPPMPLP